MRMKNKMLFLALIAIGCLLLPPARAGESDAAIKQKLMGYWRSPRHEYEFTSDGVIYMLPNPPCTTTNRWDIKNGLFYWDEQPHVIVSLTKEKFVYKSLHTVAGKYGSGGYVLWRITKEMVGEPYVPDHRFISK